MLVSTDPVDTMARKCLVRVSILFRTLDKTSLKFQPPRDLESILGESIKVRALQQNGAGVLEAESFPPNMNVIMLKH